jgi:hypothetical protein
MTNPVVTDEMTQAAVTAYDDECEDFDTEAHDALDMHTSAMRAAITAALKASGELERLRAAVKLALSAFYQCVEFSGTTDFDREIAALEAALDKLGEK